MTTHTPTRLLVVSIVLLSTLSLGLAATMPAAAQSSSGLNVTANDSVAISESMTVTLDSANAEYLAIEGDTANWTVESLDPSPAVIGNPTSTPYESGTETWYYADSQTDSLTVELSATVSPGTYSFTAIEEDLEGNVVATEEFSIEVTQKSIDVTGDSTIVTNASTSITIDSAAAEYLEVSGDTTNWTVTGMDPQPSTIGNPTTFPYVSESDTWFYGDTQTDSLTIDLKATVPPGTYNFTAAEQNQVDETIAEQPFSITVSEGHESGVSNELYTAVENADSSSDEVTLGALRNSVNQWSQTGRVGTADATLGELRSLVGWWSQN